MDKKDLKKIRNILDMALSLPEDSRKTYVHHLCSGDPVLRHEMDELLESVKDSKDLDEAQLKKKRALLENLTAHLEKQLSPAHDDLSGQKMGEWQLLELLGHGGMGSVYKAKRIIGEVHQAGALKILHKNFHTPEHIGRFRLEQQILAGLSHPNIASLIEGGISDDHTPYLVMEYVDGKALMAFCDEQNYSLEERIKLFMAICDAVQYAHINLIVHRDLKPDNILVTKEGTVKILDFGIAKLLDPNLYELSVIETQMGLGPMSLRYASPEQILGETATTSTDIYALGTLLYELLTGFHPFSGKNKSNQVLSKEIREENATAPSRLFLKPKDLPKAGKKARSRSSRPQKLGKILQGDLDAIVLKCLRKEPADRYSSLVEIKADLKAYLEGQPVSARGEAFRYRMNKYLKRNRKVLGLAGLFLLLAIGLVGYYSYRLAKERDVARQEAENARETSEFLISLFESGMPENALGKTITANMLLAKGEERIGVLENQPLVQADMLLTIGQAYESLGDYDKAMSLVDKSLGILEKQQGGQEERIADAWSFKGFLLVEQGKYDRANTYYQKTLDSRKAALGEKHPKVAEIFKKMGYLSQLKENFDSSEVYYNKALDIYKNQENKEPDPIISTQDNLALLFIAKGEYAKAEKLLQKTIADQKKLNPKHPTMGMLYNNLGYTLYLLEKFDEAEEYHLKAIAVQKEVLGEGHPEIASTLNNLAIIYQEKGDIEKAMGTFEKAAAIQLKNWGPDNPEYLTSLRNIGTMSLFKEDYKHADSLLKKVLKGRIKNLGESHSMVAGVYVAMGASQTRQRNFEQGEVYALKALGIRRKALRPNHPDVRRSFVQMMSLYKKWGKPKMEAAYRDSLTSLGK